jgi:hypothetical protein
MHRNCNDDALVARQLAGPPQLRSRDIHEAERTGEPCSPQLGLTDAQVVRELAETSR